MKLSLKELKGEKTEELLKLVEKKRKQPKDVVEVEEPEREEGKVVDLMARGEVYWDPDFLEPEDR